VPFRVRARALGFDPDEIPGAGAIDDAVDRARTVPEARGRAASYAAVFVPFALERAGGRKEIAEVRRWALADLRRQFTVEDAAAVAGLSPSHFAHVFKDATGLSFIDWINRSRMERARELLLTTDLLVREIADSVGIENAAWFGVLFKRITGATPNEIRGARGNACT
jgi:transcriptional regulator GlxA family with amidase domain